MNNIVVIVILAKRVYLVKNVRSIVPTARMDAISTQESVKKGVTLAIMGHNATSHVRRTVEANVTSRMEPV